MFKFGLLVRFFFNFIFVFIDFLIVNLYVQRSNYFKEFNYNINYVVYGICIFLGQFKLFQKSDFNFILKNNVYGNVKIYNFN